MSKYLAIITLLISTSLEASDFYVGFMFGVISRGGFILGYQVDDRHNLELHFGGVPHVMSYGLSLKRYNNETTRREYSLVGYSSTNWWEHQTGSTKTFHGMNFGYGKNTGSDKSNWSYPIEIGGGPAYNFEDEEWGPLFFVGYGAIYKEHN